MRRLRLRAATLGALALVVVLLSWLIGPLLGTGDEQLYLWLGSGALIFLLVELALFWLSRSARVLLAPLPLVPTLVFWMLRVVNVLILALALIGILSGFAVNPAAAAAGLLAWLAALALHLDNWVVRLAWLLRPGARVGTIRRPQLIVAITHSLSEIARRSQLR